MNYGFIKQFVLAGMLVTIWPIAADAQPPKTTQQYQQAVPVPPPSTAQPQQGPHGGTLKQVGSLQLETVLSQGGIVLFVFDRDGQPMSVEQGRGAASLRIEGNAKRYRYDLLPDGKGGLTAPVNLSKIAGQQIEIELQLIGLSGIGSLPLTLQEVATVPVSELQLASAAIARQKSCPVSGKPLGSMGDPLAVNVQGKIVYVCCAGCTDAIHSNPAQYAAGRPKILISSATAADAALIAQQKVCPVMDEPLGGMGQPIKVLIGEHPIYLCCKGCIKKVQAEPAKYLAMVYGSAPAVVAEGSDQVRPGIFKVSAIDAPFVAAQKRCPVMDEPLEAMGGPFKVNADGRAIYICCPGCAKKIAAEPQKYLAILAEQGISAPTIR